MTMNRFNFRLVTGGVAVAGLGVLLLVVGGMEEVDFPYWPWNGVGAIVLGIALAAISLRDVLRKD